MPIRAFGTFNCRVAEHEVMIEKLAGIRQRYTEEDVKEEHSSIMVEVKICIDTM